jgi:Ca2+-binding EF-hand superfamily protein
VLKGAFQCFDKSNSGLLAVDEMKHVLTRVGDVLSPEEISNFMAVIDVYGDSNARMSDVLKLLSVHSLR